MIPFYDDSGLLFYFHMTENGHEILVLTNPTKIILSTCEIFKRQFILTFHRYSYLFILGKFSLGYFGRMIADWLKRSHLKMSRILPRIFRIFYLNILVGCYRKHQDPSLVFRPLLKKYNFWMILKKKIADKTRDLGFEICILKKLNI